MKVDAQQVSASITVEHPATREILVNNLAQLQSSLKEQGFNVAQIDVQVVDPGNATANGQFAWNADGRSSSSSHEENSQASSRYLDRLRNRIDSRRSPARLKPPSCMDTQTMDNSICVFDCGASSPD